MKKGIEAVVSSISSEFTRLGIKVSAEKLRAAYEEGAQTLNSFNSELRKVGSEVLAKIGTEKAIIVLGRPYSAFDSRTNLNLFASLSRLGIYAIPQSFLSFDKCEINSKYPNMYWGFGNSILKASQFLKDNPNLYALYLTSFSCGPDSFILHFFNEEIPSQINLF
jgi:predicted nucleotide-binding protein (sugar kinase/HSP70/actin superfamily)